MDHSPSLRPPMDSSYSSRTSKGSIDSSPSSPSTRSASRLIQDRSLNGLPPISYRFAASSSSPSLSAASDSPYLGPSRPLSLGDGVSSRRRRVPGPVWLNALHAQYTLSPDPQKWGMQISPEYKEEDDDLHKPDSTPATETDHSGELSELFSWRGVTNVGTLLVLIAGILTLL